LVSSATYAFGQDCPTSWFSNPGILTQTYKIPTPFPNSPNDYIAFIPCGTFNDGCTVQGAGNICSLPGCCSVCQRWNVGIANEGAACLGKLAQWQMFPNNTLLMKYKGGDPIPPPGPPNPGPREAEITITFGPGNTLTNLTFVDPNGRANPDGAYVYSIYALGPLTKCAAPSVVGSCTKCTNLNNACQWCLDSASCTPNNFPGCKNFIRNPQYCPAPCSSMKSCSSCTKASCVWCNSPMGCSDDSNPSCQYQVENPAFCSSRENVIGL